MLNNLSIRAITLSTADCGVGVHAVSTSLWQQAGKNTYYNSCVVEGNSRLG